jgi:hypothetical protein
MSSFGSNPGRPGISQSDVSHAADSLLRAGKRPTIDKVRGKIGRGSPNTINPMLDAWWKTLGARLDSGPAAFHRLPEVVAHVAESLWMHAQEEARRRIRSEHKGAESQNTAKEHALEVRSHVLTLREGEFDSRLRDRDRTIEELNQRLRELTGLLRKEQATSESLGKQLAHPAPQLLARSKPRARPKSARAPRPPKRKPSARRASSVGDSTQRNTRKRSKSTLRKRRG